MPSSICHIQSIRIRILVEVSANVHTAKKGFVSDWADQIPFVRYFRKSAKSYVVIPANYLRSAFIILCRRPGGEQDSVSPQVPLCLAGGRTHYRCRCWCHIGEGRKPLAKRVVWRSGAVASQVIHVVWVEGEKVYN